jgi:2,4-dienoyl-CoA reductase (NADPH2)
LNPPGDFAFETITATYDAMISSGVYGLRNYFLFRYPALRPLFRWLWFRMKRGLPVEGVSLDEARAIKRAVTIPVINTGGWQSASAVREAIGSGAVDGVSIARSLVANPDLLDWWARGHEQPERPCTYCNRCLLNAPKNPMGCYEPLRFKDHEAMVEELMTIYRAKPELRVPTAAEV